MGRRNVSTQIFIKVLCVGLFFLIILSNCEAEKTCTTKKGEYGFCTPSMHFSYHPKDCDEHETCYSFERSLNSTGVDILNRLRGCGKIHGKRISGGENAKLYEFPWIAALSYTNGLLCAGTLITNRWVLTAAHCIKDELHAVQLGKYYFTSEFSCPKITRNNRRMCTKTKTFAIDRVVKHPDFNIGTLTMDIALIKLNQTVTFEKGIAPVCLPLSQSHTEAPVGSKMTIIGWGLTENGTQSDILQKAIIRAQPLELCVELYKRTRITKAHLCLQGDLNVSNCKGDSGGPMLRSVNRVTNSTSERYIQIGVISTGTTKCGNAPFPYPYASVINAMPWITSTID